MTEQRSPVPGLGGGGVLLLVLLGVALLHRAASRLGGPTASLHALAHSPLTRAAAVSLLLGALVAGVAAVLLAWLRLVVTERTLASRISYLVLPSEDFETSEDGVLRAAGQLSRVRRAVLGWLDPAASAVRVRLDSGADGRMAMRVQVAERGRSVVRSAFTSMGSVELRDESTAAPEKVPVRGREA